MDWKNNPTSFIYKSDENGADKTATIKDVKLFEIYNEAKYVRNTVQIDKSTFNLNNLSKVEAPEFHEETLFLKELTTGDATLYRYSETNLIRFFYRSKGNEVKHLVYKPYEFEAGRVTYNEDYKKQLAKELTCLKISPDETRNIKYLENSLVNYFIKYNNCADPNYTDTSIKNNKKGKFNLNIRPRITSASATLRQRYNSSLEMDNEVSFGFGVEGEYVFPFNRNKWAIILEPNYQTYQSEKTIDANYLVGGKLTAVVDYKYFEAQIGFRHYMFLNDKSKLFINGQLVLISAFDSVIEFKRADNSNFESLKIISSKPNIGFGFGYNYNNKYGAEVRYYTERSITDFSKNSNAYRNIAFILSYNIL